MSDRCSFCSKTIREVNAMITNKSAVPSFNPDRTAPVEVQTVTICNECVAVCVAKLLGVKVPA